MINELNVYQLNRQLFKWSIKWFEYFKKNFKFSDLTF